MEALPHGSTDVLPAVALCLSRILGSDPAAVTPEVTLESLDIDSIVIVELILGIQTDLGVKVELGDITPADTVAAVAAHVAGLLRNTQEARS
jgi:acyl carrier protein